MAFQLLPYGSQQDIVQIHCSSGDHAGKYLLVKPNNEIIAGATSEGDSVFLRQNVTTSTITLSHPADDPHYYVSFDAESRKAQLEEDLTDRSKLEVYASDNPFRKQDKQQEDLGECLPGFTSQ